MSVKNFEITPKAFIQQDSAYKGRFEFDLLAPGYGHTIGSSLRRVLLSSLEGYAVTQLTLPSDVLHEFASIDGVIQDVSEIILNLKKIRFKNIGNSSNENIIISFNNQTIFKAGDLTSLSAHFEVLNPELIICTMDESASFQLKLKVEKGYGYIPAEEHTTTQIIGQIPLDAIFTPIKNVEYKVENTLVGNKIDYEKIIMIIETDGSISPKQAIQRAAIKLIDHFSIFIEKDALLEEKKEQKEPVINQKVLLMQKKLQKQLRDLGFSVRTFNCLKANEVKTLGDIVQLSFPKLMKFRNFGKISMIEVEELLAKEGLSLGMDITAYLPEEQNTN